MEETATSRLMNRPALLALAAAALFGASTPLAKLLLAWELPYSSARGTSTVTSIRI